MSDQTVAKHKAVYLTYSILINASGDVFEQSDVPVGYVHGADSDLFEKVEAALEGKTIGDRVEVSLSADEGFGPHRPELTFTDDLDNVPPQFRHIGAEVEFESESGQPMQFRVTRIEDGKLTIDANHPLAGKDITFIVNVAGVRDATPEEIQSGMPADMMNRLQ